MVIQHYLYSATPVFVMAVQAMARQPRPETPNAVRRLNSTSQNA